MSRTTMLIHGAWLNCWEGFKACYEAGGHAVIAPSRPLDERSPAELRASRNPALAKVGINELINHYDRLIRALRKELAANRSQFYLGFASGPFYGYNRSGSKPSQAIICNWWRQGMMGGAKAHYDGIKAFSETDFAADLKSINLPTLVMHGDDDQIVPIADSAPLSAKLLKNSTLKVYEKFPHGMCTTRADVINPDLLAFVKS